METKQRDRNGRFTLGNAGGPGRPRRTVETDYLAALNDELSLDSWQRIVRRAIEHAEAGDWRARDWLSKYVLPNVPKTQLLLNLAAEEERGVTREDRVATTALRQQRQEQLQANAYRSLL